MRRMLFLLIIPLLCSWPSINMGGGVPVAAGGGPFTFVASASGAADTSGTTVSTSSTLDVAAGDLLIAYATDEDVATSVTIKDQDNNNVFTFDTGEDVHGGTNQANAYPLYKINATAKTGATFTATYTDAAPYKKLIVMQYRPGSGETVTKDISGTRENSGEGATITTGSFSTTGTDGVVCAGEGYYNSGTFSGSTINSVAADQTKSQNSAHVWCRIVTAGLSTVTAQTTYSGSNTFWATTVIAFKAE